MPGGTKKGGDIIMKQSSTDKVISTAEEWFTKLPALPKDARALIVKITPWVALIFGILGIIGGVGALGILGGASPFVIAGGGMQSLGGGMLAVIIGIISSVLLLAAFPGTRAHKEKGWKLLFWSEAVSTVGALLAISLFGVLIALIGFYLIFQIKSYYK